MTSVIDFVQAVLTLRLRFEFSVTSWGRTDKHNLVVGGKVGSRHLTWQAVDIRLDNGTDKATFRSAAERLGLKVVDEPDHLHLQTP